MNGGKVLWFLDGAQASMDSLVNGTTVALLNELNVEDQLFKYGVRINPDLVQDVQSALIPVNTALSGNSPNFVPVPWYYYPLLKGNQQHPVSRNLNLIKAEFASSMDTISTNPSIRKTVLLTTSELSRKVNVPVFINLQEIMDQPQRKDFAGRNLPVAILLEGTFESVFKNRLLTGIDIQGDYTFRESGKKTAIIVVSDGDIIKNEVRVTPQGPMVIPLGYDKYSGQTFGNAEFVLNAMNYLTDEAGLLSLRSREFKLRLLDRNKIHESRLFWQLFNSLGPVLIVVLTGLLFIFYRKYRYTK